MEKCMLSKSESVGKFDWVSDWPCITDESVKQNENYRKKNWYMTFVVDKYTAYTLALYN